MEGIFKPHDDTVLLNLGGGTTRRILAWNDRLMSVEVGFETGAVGAAHTHPHTQLSYVLAGRFRYTVEGNSVEMKNVNSIKGAYKALKFELVRQKNLMKRGVEVKQETRAYLESQMITVGMRMKEDADDYRFITDPDLPPMKISDETIQRILETMPEAPHNKVKRFVEDYDIDEESAKVLTSELDLAIAYEEVVKEVDSKFAAKIMRDELKRVLSYNKLDFADSGITSDD
jgi:aspartyl-tRNA(Asn)/glutamyl-tRNA(Gln) amidotransferase subunit B